MWIYTSRLLNGMPTCRACRSSHVLGPRIPLVPGAYFFQSKGPLRCAYAYTLGVALDCPRRLIVASACGSSRSHNVGGELVAVPTNMLRKCALKFRMATSAALRRWQPGGTNSSIIFYSSQMMVFIAFDTSLSRMCF